MDMDVAYAGDCEFTVGIAGVTGGMNQLQVGLIPYRCSIFIVAPHLKNVFR